MIKLLIGLLLIIKSLLLEYKKNINITSSDKGDIRSVMVEDLQTLQENITNNTIIVFYADWCPHCKDFLPVFDDASQYIKFNNFNFYKVNCANKQICSHFDVNKFPTIKVFYRGKELDSEPGRDLISVLEYLDKLSTDSLIKLKDESEIAKFKENYGDHSFKLFHNENDIEKYKFIEKIAEERYKQYFYVSCINSDKSKLVLNEDYGLSINLSEPYESIENFIEKNKFPLIRKMSSNYIKKLQKENRIAVMGAINTLDNDHRIWLNTVFTKYALSMRKYVFSYIDVNQDVYLFNYFKVNGNLPQIVVYDFENRKFFTHNNDNISEVLFNLENDTLIWTSGNWFEDILVKFGIKLNQNSIMYIIGGAFLLIIVFIIIIITYSGEKNEDEERQKVEKEMNEKKNN